MANISVEAEIEIKCDDCRNIIKTNCKYIDFEVVETDDERQMGAELHHAGRDENECDQCGATIVLEVSVWEYPENVYETWECTVSRGEIIQKPEDPLVKFGRDKDFDD